MIHGELRVAVVGATGIIGQQFLAALAGHPWFKTTHLAASTKSANKKYLDAISDPETGSVGWYCDDPMPEDVRDLVVENAAELDVADVDLVFTALESDAARELEPRYAKDKPVLSTASAFRYEEDVPILLPGVNTASHRALLEVQKKNRGWKGFITPNANCTTVGLAMTLAPLHQAFGVKRVHMTSLQAISGAGRGPGVLGLDIIDNIVPYIPKEEEKVERETQKILGEVKQNKVQPAEILVSCTCMRVNVTDAHTESVFVALDNEVEPDEIKKVMSEFGREFTELGLPSSPPALIVVADDPYHPQPRMDRDIYDGMATVVGRIRPDRCFDNGAKYVLLSHNTKMGGAKGCLLAAEYLVKIDYI